MLELQINIYGRQLLISGRAYVKDVGTDSNPINICGRSPLLEQAFIDSTTLFIIPITTHVVS
jgi:hypothetical protein